MTLTQTFDSNKLLSDSSSFGEAVSSDNTPRFGATPAPREVENGTVDLDADSRPALEDLIDNMLSAAADAKQELASELVDRITIEDDKAARAAWAAYLILRSPKPGRLRDCVAILSRLGRHIVLGCILDASIHRPPTPDADPRTKDYWFALVRALGFLYRQQPDQLLMSMALDFSRDRCEAIREAALDSLADMAGPEAETRIREIAENDSSPILRETASDIFDDLADGVS